MKLLVNVKYICVRDLTKSKNGKTTTNNGTDKMAQELVILRCMGSRRRIGEPQGWNGLNFN